MTPESQKFTLPSDNRVWNNGQVVLEKDVTFSVRSKALNYGHGVFEGLRAYWDEEHHQLNLFHAFDHFSRLKEVSKIMNLEFPFTVEELIQGTVDLLRANDVHENTYIRPLVLNVSDNIGPSLANSKPRVVIYTQPMQKRVSKDELTAGFSSWQRVSDNMIPPHAKVTGAYVNLGLAMLEAEQNGFDEVLFLNAQGQVSEGARENFFMFKHGQLVTPPTSADILEGITRRTVLELARDELHLPVVERTISRTEVYGAQEAFVSRTAMEVSPLVEIDHRVIGDGHEGEVVAKLRDLLKAASTGKLSQYQSFLTSVY